MHRARPWPASQAGPAKPGLPAGPAKPGRQAGPPSRACQPGPPAGPAQPGQPGRSCEPPEPGMRVCVHQLAEVLAGLSRSYLFEGMTRDQLEPLARAATTRRRVRGEFVIHVGDRAGEIFVVMSGEVKDSVVDVDGEEVIHFVHGPGMTFGEPGFFSVERTRILEVIAVQPTTLIRLDRRDLRPFMERHGIVKDRVLEALASKTRWQATMISSLAARRPLTERLVLRLLEMVDSSPERRKGQASTPKISQSTLAASDRGEQGARQPCAGRPCPGWVDPAAGRALHPGGRAPAAQGSGAGADRGPQGPAGPLPRPIAARTISVLPGRLGGDPGSQPPRTPRDMMA